MYQYFLKLQVLFGRKYCDDNTCKIKSKSKKICGAERKATENSKAPPGLHHQNEQIVVRTTVPPGEEIQDPQIRDICPIFVKTAANQTPKLGDPNTRSADQIFGDEVEDGEDGAKQPFQGIKEQDLHKYILEDVAEFYQQFPNLQTDVRILISKNVIVYVLGTNHANTQCKDDVVEIIKKVKPKTVLVELCSLRACSCPKHRSNAFQSTPKFTFRYLRTIITQLGFLPAMIFFTDVFREHLVSESSLLHYGGEFIAAMATAQSLKNCRIILADRPIEITVKRQASAMGNWRGLRVTLQVTLALMFKRKMKELMLSANRLVFDDPKTYEVLVFERDLYLTYSIQEAAKEFETTANLARIVAVIGQGHMQGIQTYWGKVPSEFIPFIMSPQTVLDQ